MKPFHGKSLVCLLATISLFQKNGFSQIAEGSNAPNFQAKIIGSSVDFIFSGNLQKPVVLFFWDGSDEEIEDLKSLDSFAKENSGTFQAVSVFYGSEGQSKEVEAILRNNSISLATLLTNPEFEEQYKVDQTPTIFVIDTNNRIVLSKAGFRLTSEVFDLITALNSGTLRITCNQSGAAVYLNNRFVGIISGGILRITNLKPGTYQLQVQKNEYTTFSQSISIASGQNTPVNAPLTYISPPKGSLTVTCNQERADVYLEGTWRGRISSLRNLTIPNLNAGTYELKVQGSNSGDVSYRSVRIDNGQNTTVDVNFSPRPFVPTPPTTPSTPQTWREQKPRTIGSYLGIFAGYTAPLYNFKSAFNDHQPMNFGARIRLMSKKALAWEFSGSYYQFKNNNSAYQLTQKIVPITLNMTVGAKYFYLTGGGGYYFSRHTVESSFTGKIEGKRDRWGLNTGVGIGFAFFEIGARYHYIVNDIKNNASNLNFLDIYGGITPISKAEAPYDERNKQKGVLFTYSYFPASADVNSNYIAVTRKTPKAIESARLYRASYLILGKGVTGVDFGIGHMPFGDIKFPLQFDMNLLIHLPLAPRNLDLNFGIGGGLLLLLSQRYAQPSNRLDNRFEPSGTTQPAVPFFAQGFAGLRFSPFKGISLWGDGGYIFFTKISNWSYKRSGQSDNLDLNPEWLQYKNIRIGGRSLRAGILLGL